MPKFTKKPKTSGEKMATECKRCLNIETYDTLLSKPIRITPNGQCNQCLEWENSSKEFFEYRENAKTQLPKIFNKVKRKQHEYDALVALSGGKDSSVALILAKEKYDLNVLAFTTDKGNFYDGVKENINRLTDQLGVDHIFIKAPKPLLNRLFRFGISTLSTGGIQCKVCGGLAHVPILSRFLLNYDIPIVITGLDLWEIQTGFNLEKSRKTKVVDPFLYTLPSLKKRWNNYQGTINDCLSLIQRFSREEDFPQLQREFLDITSELVTRYGLSPKERKKFNKLKVYDIGLTAIEISTKKDQLALLEKYGWAPPRDLLTGELIGTDCRIGGLVNALTTFDQKRKMWSYRIRSGLVTKDEALEEITKKEPNLEQLCYTLHQLGMPQLVNRLKRGWQNHKFKGLYNQNVIEQVNAQLSKNSS